MLPLQPNNHNLTPLYNPGIRQSIHETKNNKELSQEQSSEGVEESNDFIDEDIEELEFVSESSPEKAQDIVRYLQDPT